MQYAQNTATHCSTLQLAATNCNTLQHTATHCNTLQHTATHCNTPQHTAIHCNTLQHHASYCNTLQHTTTYCNTLKHTATHCNKQQRHVSTRSPPPFAHALACILHHQHRLQHPHPYTNTHWRHGQKRVSTSSHPPQTQLQPLTVYANYRRARGSKKVLQRQPTKGTTHCNTLQLTGGCGEARGTPAKAALDSNGTLHILQHSATHCNALQHTATHCNICSPCKWRSRTKSFLE